MPEKFYVTTPIYYVNARPHIGHAYTTIVADVLARRHRLLGDDTFFLTGTDEHGQKIERSAQAAGIPPQQFADQVSEQFRALWRRMGLTNDDYIRTTDPRHKQGAQKLFATLYERGFIYLDSYTGAYCVSDEAFVDLPVGTPCPDCGRLLEQVTEENFFFKLSTFQRPVIDLIESNTLLITPDSARNEVLSFLRGGLKDLSVSRSSFSWGIPVPEPAASASPQKHVIYVWLDALANYMTAVGYGSDAPEDQAKFAKYWPADLHLVGKEITRFHCIYWPAFLLALNPSLQQPPATNSVIPSEAKGPCISFEPATLPFEDHKAWAAKMLPKQITANGWLLFDNSKMSKSKGNVVRTETILDAFGTLCPAPVVATNPQVSTTPKELSSFGEAGGSASQPEAPHSSRQDRDLFAADILRYFLLREIPYGQDGTFSFEAMVTRYNADLANGYGNLVSRTLSMIQQYFDGEYQPFAVREFFAIPGVPNAGDLPRILFGAEPGLDVYDPDEQDGDDLRTAIETHIYDQEFAQGLELFSRAVSAVDQYLTTNAPWKLAKQREARERLAEVLMNAAEAIKYLTSCIHDVMPYATGQVWSQLGLGDIEQAAKSGQLNNLQWGGLKPGTKLGPLSPIFPRADKGLIQQMTDVEFQNAPKSLNDPTPNDGPAPDAAPRTTTLAEANPGATVAGSAAVTTEREPTPPAEPADVSPQITIDDFAKIDLRVAQIVVAERIPKADKLLRLEVDLGYEKRQILSGIAEFYTPEELVGRRIVVITNLAPRKMRGLESHGMLLAASEGDHGKPALATCGEDIALGSRLK